MRFFFLFFSWWWLVGWLVGWLVSLTFCFFVGGLWRMNGFDGGICEKWCWVWVWTYRRIWQDLFCFFFSLVSCCWCLRTIWERKGWGLYYRAVGSTIRVARCLLHVQGEAWAMFRIQWLNSFYILIWVERSELKLVIIVNPNETRGNLPWSRQAIWSVSVSHALRPLIIRYAD